MFRFHARHQLDDEAFGYVKRVIVTPAVCTCIFTSDYE